MADEWPLLSARWINTRVKNVYDRSVEIMEKLIEEITESGYLPGEGEFPPELDDRLTPEQKQGLGLAPPDEQLALLE